MTKRNVLRVGGVIAVLIALVLGGLAAFGQSKVSFGEEFIRTNLGAQKIVFPSEKNPDGSTNEEVASDPELQKYAGQQMITGDQARVYADNYIGLHMRHDLEDATLKSQAGLKVNERLNKQFADIGGDSLAGHTYATLGQIARGVDPTIESDPAERAAMEADIKLASEMRQTINNGELLRGTLLSAYGWSELVAVGTVVLPIVWAAAAALLLSGFVLLVASTRIRV